MLNDPELLMLMAREKQEELRRTMKSARQSRFWRKRSLLPRPMRTVVLPLRSARRGL